MARNKGPQTMDFMVSTLYRSATGLPWREFYTRMTVTFAKMLARFVC